MPLKLEHTDERLTRRAGLILVNRFGDSINLASAIDRAFRAPGSNRGFAASHFILTLVEMIIDGATCLEDVRLFEHDEAYKEMVDCGHYPTSDALGDWLRRHGDRDGEKRLWSVIASLIRTMSGGSGLTLDIDGTIIEADKGDGKMSYKDIRGYHPLVGACCDTGLFVGSYFQYGNAVPQESLVDFIHQCVKNHPGTFSTVRSDSAGYNSAVINDCFDNNRRFTITADHDIAVMRAIHEIPENACKIGRDRNGVKEDYHVGETVHTMQETKHSFRLIVKRTLRQGQADFFDGVYHYWIIATNIPEDEKNAQAIIHFHQQRGELEKMIGELKHHYNLDHLPCGQFSANCLFFAVGILAHTLVQLLKKQYFGDEWKKKSIRSLRYYWLHIPARIISHARYTIAKIAMLPKLFEQFLAIYLRICLSPPPA